MWANQRRHSNEIITLNLCAVLDNSMRRKEKNNAHFSRLWMGLRRRPFDCELFPCLWWVSHTTCTSGIWKLTMSLPAIVTAAPGRRIEMQAASFSRWNRSGLGGGIRTAEKTIVPRIHSAMGSMQKWTKAPHKRHEIIRIRSAYAHRYSLPFPWKLIKAWRFTIRCWRCCRLPTTLPLSLLLFDFDAIPIVGTAILLKLCVRVDKQRKKEIINNKKK